MSIERKYKTRTAISLKDSPKIVLTTNYTVIGEGSSFDRRKIELEFSEYYNKNNTPDMEFGHRLFEDWSFSEWSLFDNFMLHCIKVYLKSGVIPPTHINLKQRKLLQLTKKEFVEFADALPRNKEFNKLNAYNDFIKDYPDFENVKQRTFTSWLKIYPKYSNQDLILTERHSDKDRFFTLIQKPRPVA